MWPWQKRVCAVELRLVCHRVTIGLDNHSNGPVLVATLYPDQTKTRREACAIIAMARKFLDIVSRTLEHKWGFVVFPNLVLAEF